MPRTIRPLVDIACQTCTKSFQARPIDRERGHAKYCSKQCSGIAWKLWAATRPKPQSNSICAYCATSFYRNPSSKLKSKSGLLFCCREHKDIAQRLGGIEAIQPDHYGAGNHAYREIAFRHHPKQCSRCGYDRIPEVIAVHHKDSNRENNHPSNLEPLCPTCHTEHHFITQTGYWKRRLANSLKMSPRQAAGRQ